MPETSLELLHLLDWNNLQIERLADGLDPDPALSGTEAARAVGISEARVLAALLARRDSLST